MRQKRRYIKRGGRIFAQIPRVPGPHAHTKQLRQDTMKRTRLYSAPCSACYLFSFEDQSSGHRAVRYWESHGGCQLRKAEHGQGRTVLKGEEWKNRNRVRKERRKVIQKDTANNIQRWGRKQESWQERSEKREGEKDGETEERNGGGQMTLPNCCM